MFIVLLILYMYFILLQYVAPRENKNTLNVPKDRRNSVNYNTYVNIFNIFCPL